MKLDNFQYTELNSIARNFDKISHLGDIDDPAFGAFLYFHSSRGSESEHEKEQDYINRQRLERFGNSAKANHDPFRSFREAL